MAGKLGRREFLQGAAAAATAVAVSPEVEAQVQQRAERKARRPHQAKGNAPDQAYLFLDPVEAAFVTAAIDVFLPADDIGPGGVEAGVVHYIDRQLAGAFGAGDRLYLAGPWAEGTPQQGYQLPLTPAQFYRGAIAEANRACHDAYGKPFAELPSGQRNEVLAGLQTGDIGLAGLPGKVFVNLLLANTIEGYFADPAYGGNRNMAAWRMIGFPGARGAYVEDIDTYRGKAFPSQPVSLADLQ